jgi:hypothetical protein
MSDRQEIFVSGVAAGFPGVPHRSCRNPFLLDLAQPVWELDSHAKVEMRSKVRGLRSRQRAVLPAHRPEVAVSAAVAKQNASPVAAEPAVSQSVPAAPVWEQAASWWAAPRPVPSLAVADWLTLSVLAEEDLSPAVSQSVPAAPRPERAARPPDIMSE